MAYLTPSFPLTYSGHSWCPMVKYITFCLRIMHTGEILRSMRLTIKATCPMDLSNFPMDSQLCTVEIESFGYTMTDLRYKWADGKNFKRTESFFTSLDRRSVTLTQGTLLISYTAQSTPLIYYFWPGKGRK